MSGKYCSLSFDDGPNTTTTLQMLDVLKKHNVKASFFVEGRYINDETAAAMKACFDYGCDIENHSWTHSFMNEWDEEKCRDEVTRTSDLIEKIVGVRPKFFRPPFIAVSETMYKAIDLPFICGFGCEDWEPKVSVDERIRRMLSVAGNGVIYLLHDMKGNDMTVETVDKIIPLLKEKGFEFVTVPEIFEKCNVDPNREWALWRNVLTDAVGKPRELGGQ